MKIDRLLSSSRIVFLLLGIIIFLIGNGIAYIAYFSSSVIIQIDLRNFYAVLFIILGISFYFQYQLLFYRSIMEGLNNFIFTSKMTIIQNTLILIGVILITLFDLNLIALAVLYMMTSIIMLVSYIINFKVQYSNYFIKLNLFELNEVKRIIGFSLSVQAMTVFNALIDPIVKYLLSTFLSVTLVPAYEIARRFAIAISGLFFNAFKIVLPKASILKTPEEIKSFIRNDVTKYCRLGVTYSCFSFGVFSLPIAAFIYLVFGIEEAVLIFLILALPESINNFGYSIYNMLLGVGKVYLLATIQFINLMLMTISVWIGFSLFHSTLGLLGYFVSVIIGNVLMILFIKNKWDISLKNFFSKSKVIMLTILLTLMALTLLIIYYNFASIFLSFVLLSTISFLLFRKEIKYYYSIFHESILSKYL